MSDRAPPYRVLTDSEGLQFIRCTKCRHESYNANDIAEKYCVYCHKWHEKPPPENDEP